MKEKSIYVHSITTTGDSGHSKLSSETNKGYIIANIGALPLNRKYPVPETLTNPMIAPVPIK